MEKRHINNEGGFVLITSLLMLVILTIIGISATNTTTTEVQIAGNDKFAKKEFYNLESTLSVGAAWTKENRSMLQPRFPTNTGTFPDDNNNGIDDRSEVRDANGNVVGTFKIRDVKSLNSSTGQPNSNVPWSDASSFANFSRHPADMLPVSPAKLELHNKASQNSILSNTSGLTWRLFIITSYSEDKSQILQEVVRRVVAKP